MCSSNAIFGRISTGGGILRRRALIPLLVGGRTIGPVLFEEIFHG